MILEFDYKVFRRDDRVFKRFVMKPWQLFWASYIFSLENGGYYLFSILQQIGVSACHMWIVAESVGVKSWIVGHFIWAKALVGQSASRRGSVGAGPVRLALSTRRSLPTNHANALLLDRFPYTCLHGLADSIA